VLGEPRRGGLGGEGSGVEQGRALKGKTWLAGKGMVRQGTRFGLVGLEGRGLVRRGLARNEESGVAWQAKALPGWDKELGVVRLGEDWQG